MSFAVVETSSFWLHSCVAMILGQGVAKALSLTRREVDTLQLGVK